MIIPTSAAGSLIVPSAHAQTHTRLHYHILAPTAPASCRVIVFTATKVDAYSRFPHPRSTVAIGQ